jgi:protein-S-isoprenylcysteine O-methyltransferase Ste14
MSGGSNSSTPCLQGWWWVAVQTLLIAAMLLAPARPAAHVPLIVGWAVLSAGLLLFGLAWVALGRAFTPNPVPKNNAQLTVQGVYRNIRHPMYSAVMLCALGWSMAGGGVLHYALSAVLILFLYAKSRAEERWLAQRYRAYAQYCAVTGRFLPRLKKTKI